MPEAISVALAVAFADPNFGRDAVSEFREVRLDRRHLPIPGFLKFVSRISGVPLLSYALQGPLASVRGLYLLVQKAGE